MIDLEKKALPAHFVLAVCWLALMVSPGRILVSELESDASTIQDEIDRYARGVYAHPDDI